MVAIKVDGEFRATLEDHRCVVVFPARNLMLALDVPMCRVLVASLLSDAPDPVLEQVGRWVRTTDDHEWIGGWVEFWEPTRKSLGLYLQNALRFMCACQARDPHNFLN